MIHTVRRSTHVPIAFLCLLPLLILLCLLMTGCSGDPAPQNTPSAVEKIPVEELTASAESTGQPAPATATASEPEPVQAASGLIPVTGNIVFCGDSRTIDLFADSDEEIPGGNRDGFTVFARHAANYEYMQGVLANYDPAGYDTFISWMGANDHGEFERYRPLYESVLNSGKSLILCTIGPTDESALKGNDPLYYTDRLICQFNSDLIQWAAVHDVPVIDLYTYIKNNSAITLDPADGVHYLPRPTRDIWQYFLSCVEKN